MGTGLEPFGISPIAQINQVFSDTMLRRRLRIQKLAEDQSPTAGAGKAAPDARTAAKNDLKDAGYGSADNPLTEDAVQAAIGRQPAPAMNPDERRVQRGTAFQWGLQQAVAAARSGDVTALSNLLGQPVTRAPGQTIAASAPGAPAAVPGDVASLLGQPPASGATMTTGYLVGGKQISQEYLEQVLIPQAVRGWAAEQVHELDANRQAGVAPRLPGAKQPSPKFTYVGNGRFFDPVSGQYAEAPPVSEETLANEKRLAQSKRANSMTITDGGDGKKWRIVTTPEGTTTTSPIEEIPAKSNLTIHVGPETKTVRIDGIDKQVTNTVSRTFNKNTGKQIGDPEILAEGSAKPGEVLDHVGTGIINGKKMYFIAHSQDGRMTDKVWSDTMPAKYAKLLKDSPTTERAITVTQARMVDGEKKLFDLKGVILVQRLADGKVRYAFPVGDFGDEARKQYGGLSAPPDETGGPGLDFNGNAAPAQTEPPAPPPIAPHPSESDATRHIPIAELETWRNDLAAKVQAGDKKAVEQMSQVDLAIAARKGANVPTAPQGAEPVAAPVPAPVSTPAEDAANKAMKVSDLVPGEISPHSGKTLGELYEYIKANPNDAAAKVIASRAFRAWMARRKPATAPSAPASFAVTPPAATLSVRG